MFLRAPGAPRERQTAAAGLYSVVMMMMMLNRLVALPALVSDRIIFEQGDLRLSSGENFKMQKNGRVLSNSLPVPASPFTPGGSLSFPCRLPTAYCQLPTATASLLFVIFASFASRRPVRRRASRFSFFLFVPIRVNSWLVFFAPFAPRRPVRRRALRFVSHSSFFNRQSTLPPAPGIVTCWNTPPAAPLPPRSRG